MKIIFLDLDGVVNRRTGGEPEVSPIVELENVENLNKVIRSSDAQIVLTTSWRHMAYSGAISLVGFGWMFHTWGLEANDKVIGAIELAPPQADRGELISKWLNLFNWKPEKYVVIDDLDLGITDAKHPFVRTDSHKGFTSENAELAIGFLS